MYNLNSNYGKAMAAGLHSLVPAFGRVFIVTASGDAGEERFDRLQQMFRPDPKGQVRFYTSLETAYDDATSNNNDIILLDGDGTHTVASGITWSKNRVNVMGMDGGDRLIQQGAKIQLATNTVDTTATITVSGIRNSFRNLKIMNSGTHANSVAAVIGNGDEGTLWKNCTFQKLSDLGETAVSDFECRSDSSSFIDCEFGFSTLVITAARRSLWFKASGATRAKDCRWRNCRFVVCSSSATYNFIDVDTTASLAFSTIFDNCIFEAVLTSTGSAITNAVQSVSGLVEGQMSFINPAAFHCTNFCDTVTDQVHIIGPVPTGATTGLAVVAS